MFRIAFYIFCFLFPTSINASSASGEGRERLIPKFEHIRTHVENIPVGSEVNLESLSKYLVSIAKNDTEKTYAIYYWLTNNIKYDVKGFRTGNTGDLSPNGVLKRKSAVCSGYSRLFVALGKKSGLDVKEVVGSTKGYSYFQGGTLGSHAWNAVKLNGKWQLLDATWAAGYVNIDFNRKQNDFYFLTRPERFVYAHLPDVDKWQLLSNPLSEKEFIDNIDLKSNFFLYGLELDSHLKNEFSTNKAIQITLKSQKNIIFSTDLLNPSLDKLENHVFTQRDNGKQIFYISFPKDGKYELLIYAKKVSEKGQQYDQVLKYNIHVSSLVSPIIQYPKTYTAFGSHKAILYHPFEYQLQKGKKYTFKIRLSGASNVAVVNDGNFNLLSKDGDVFTGQVIVTGDNVSLNAKLDPQDNNYTGLVLYQGR